MHTFMDTHRVSLEVRGLERQVLAPGGSSFFYSFLVITGFGNTGSPGTSTLKKLMANEPLHPPHRHAELLPDADKCETLPRSLCEQEKRADPLRPAYVSQLPAVPRSAE